MGLNQRPEWHSAKYGMKLELPYHEKNKEFLEEMKRIVPREEREWDGLKKQWWVSDAYLDEVDNLIFYHFEVNAIGRDD
jgi:hypothetical protein